MINKQSKAEKYFISSGKEKINEQTTKEILNDMEANDTYLKIKKNINHTHNDKSRTTQSFGKIKLKPHSAPRLVATPLPPLNLR